MNTGSPPRPRDVPNTLGLHALIWADRWDTEAAERPVRLTADAGSGLVELPVLEPDAPDLGRVRRSPGRAGLGVRCSLGLPFDADISSADAAVVARGEDLLNRVLEASAELGSPLLTGVLYSALGKYAQPPAASRGGAAAVPPRPGHGTAPPRPGHGTAAAR
jgi:D-psicose/D-tagatose/L-ribulose 3-epimerase